MGMKAAMATTSKPVADLGKSLGFCETTMDEFEAVDNRSNKTTVSGNRDSKLPVPSMVASQLLDMLGLSDPPSKGMDTFELILLHVGAIPDDDRGTAIPENLDWIDALIGEIKSLMQIGTEVANHLYLALVMGYGDTAIIHDRTDLRHLPSLEKLGVLPLELQAIRPRQTYTMTDGNMVRNVRNHHPLLVVNQMDGVIRRDAAQILSVEEFQKRGGSLTISADRFLYEIAFKLWKGPKYGA